ncbi:MAG TPA: YciI family protein [Propionibacteriaceae bacterium]|nr:YciI family protein [Propionibacteriaceae bacterium]
MEPSSAPAEFDVRTLVLLVRPVDAPDLSEEELDRLQVEHLSYGASLAERGLTVANGPFTDQTDPALRGLSVYTVGAEEALTLAREDPSVRAGRLRPLVVRWWTGAGRIDFPHYGRPVGERRSLADLG